MPKKLASKKEMQAMMDRCNKTKDDHTKITSDLSEQLKKASSRDRTTNDQRSSDHGDVLQDPK